MHIFTTTAICALLLTACGEQETGSPNPPNEAEATAAWPRTSKTNSGNFAVTLKPSKGEIVDNEHFSLDLSIEPLGDDQGAIEVKVDADMPAHEHGMNTQPELVPLGERSYRVDGMLFHMAGEWVVMVDVTRDGTTERANFPVQVE